MDDPWAARDAYVEVLLGRRTVPDLVNGSGSDIGVATRLLALQESNLAMFTSCGWFFSDVGGIETQQVLRYAARVVELLESLDVRPPLREFEALLAQARSNDPGKGDAATLFRQIRSGHR